MSFVDNGVVGYCSPLIITVAFNSICYGMELKHVKGTTALRLKKTGLDTHIAARFVNRPLAKELFVAREEALSSIASAGGATTCFGMVCGLIAQAAEAHNGRGRPGLGDETNLSGFQARWRDSRVYYRAFPA
jgi:hypothetical protein